MKRLRSWMGITLAVVVTISVLLALTAPTMATTADISGSPSEELPIYTTTHHGLQNRSVEYAPRFETLKDRQGERVVTESRRAFPDAHYRQLRERPFERLNSVIEGGDHMEEMRFGGLPTTQSLGEPRLTQGSGHLNLSGNYLALWNESLEANATYTVVIPDIDGDGNPDVLVYTGKYDSRSNIWTVKLIAKNSANGTHLWEQSINGTSCDILVDWFGDLDGDGFDDVIVYEWTYNQSSDTEKGRLTAKKGTNGTHLWEQSVSASGYWNCDIFVDWIEDLDGDGFDDVIVFEWTYNLSTDIDTDKLIAKKGTNGTHFWEQTVSGKYSSIGLVFFGDLDNDSLPDVLVRESAYNATAATNTAKLIAKRGTDGTHLWEQSIIETTSEIGVWFIGDLDDDNLDDLIVREYEYNGTTAIETVTVLAKKGIDGTHLWEQSVSGSDCGIEIWLADDLSTQ